MSPVLDLFGKGNDVLQTLTITFATTGVEFKVEPSNSCRLGAAGIKRVDFDVRCEDAY